MATKELDDVYVAKHYRAAVDAVTLPAKRSSVITIRLASEEVDQPAIVFGEYFAVYKNQHDEYVLAHLQSKYVICRSDNLGKVMQVLKGLILAGITMQGVRGPVDIKKDWFTEDSRKIKETLAFFLKAYKFAPGFYYDLI